MRFAVARMGKWMPELSAINPAGLSQNGTWASVTPEAV